MADGDTNFEANRENLLDVVLERLTKSGKSTILTRIIVVARFSKREPNEDSLRGAPVTMHHHMQQRHDGWFVP